MKTISRLRYFIYLSILFVGCTTGKNALQKGNYDASVIKSVNRLKNSPKNAEAMQVLPEAYQLALQTHLKKIDEAKLSADVLRWETVLYEYEKVNQLSDEINGCPACLTLVPNPQKFITEVNDVKYKAAEVRYTLGVNLMKNRDRQSAKDAYLNFEKVQQLYPKFKDIGDKLDQAYWAAAVKVVVQPVLINSRAYQLSNQYFQQEIDRFISNYQRNRFVVFYTKQQAAVEKITPHQIINLAFDDFIVGQTYIKERVEKLRKDSVLIGETRNKRPIYGTVKAALSVFQKSISSSGLLDFNIVDWNSKNIINEKKLSGTYVWEDSWASYNGDERALDKYQLALCRKKEVLPPPPEELFIEFTKPIYNQLVYEINNFYSKY